MKGPTVCNPIRSIAWSLCGVLCFAVAGFAQENMPGSGGHHAADEAHAGHFDDFDLPEDPELVHRRQESFLAWMIRSMGLIGLLIPFVGLFGFVLTLITVIRGNGPFAALALALIVPMPLLLGLFGTIQGMIMSFQVIATSTVAPKPYQIADGIATALFTPLLGLVVMAPSYLVALFGAFLRSLARANAETP